MQSTKNDITFNKKIGKVKYEVQIIFSQKNTERFNDKIFRLIKNDLVKTENDVTHVASYNGGMQKL